MLLNIRWGSLRAKIIAWFLVPLACILFGLALVLFLPSAERTRGPLLMGLLLIFSLAIPITIVSFGMKRIVAPITELTSAAQEVARGNFGLTVTAETGDEIEELAEQFNLMSHQLQHIHENLEQIVNDRTRELATLNAIAEVVSCSLDLDEILDAALGEVIRRLGVNSGVIRLAEDDVLKLQVQKGLPESIVPDILAIELDEGLAGQTFTQVKPITADIQEYASYNSERVMNVLSQQGVQSLISVPISHQGRAQGTITLHSKAKREFLTQEMELLTSIGQQIGVAVENAQLYEQAKQEIARRRQVEEELRCANQESARQNRELTLLNRVMIATTSNLEPNEVLRVICSELVSAFGAAQAAAALLDPGGGSLTIAAECKAEDGLSALGVVIPVQENPATLYVLKHKKPLALADAQNDILLTPVRELMRQRKVVSLLLLPIIVRGEVVGTIGLDSWTKRDFSEAEITLASRIAAAAAQVLERESSGKKKA